MHLTNTLPHYREQITGDSRTYPNKSEHRVLISRSDLGEGVRSLSNREVMGGLKISTQTASMLSPFHDPLRDEANEVDLGELGAKLLLGLNSVYPRALDVAENAKTECERTMVDQLWSNFQTQGIVRGSASEGTLTRTGHQALQGALMSTSSTSGQQPPTGQAAYLLLLGIMRRHFRQEASAP